MSGNCISADPDRMAGAPTIGDTRVTVSAVLGQLAAGQTVEEILGGYPDLEPDDIFAALAFGAASLQRDVPFNAE
jgi:uncharacterized protein (DUF433 family)